ncbi:hypothetical protein OA248_00065 [Candidatus Pelagibacter sp.]|nr:hypothetical protein [Candidatus Pelagibacter sp.]
MIYFLQLKNILSILIFFLILTSQIFAKEKKVFYAGFSFSGNYMDKSSIKYTDPLTKIKNENGIDIISQSLLNTIKETNPSSFTISFDFADIEKGLEESVVMAVVLDHEEFFYEYEPISKTYINNIQMFFQIMFYDFKSRKLIASIPYDVSMPFFTKKELNEIEIREYIKKFYIEGLKSMDDEKNINAFSMVKTILDSFVLKEKYKFRAGVTKINFEEKSLNFIPEKYKKNLNYLKNVFAQLFSSRLSLHNDIALVPYNEGMAIGAKMKQQFVNSDVIYDIELPKPDFNIEISIRGFKKVLAQKSEVNNIFFWASFINLNIYQPALEKTYMNDNLKNVIKKSIPSQIENINDWYKFNSSMYELFDSYSMNIKNLDSKWVLKTNDSKNFSQNMKKVNKLMEKLK